MNVNILLQQCDLHLFFLKKNDNKCKKETLHEWKLLTEKAASQRTYPNLKKNKKIAYIFVGTILHIPTY